YGLRREHSGNGAFENQVGAGKSAACPVEKRCRASLATALQTWLPRSSQFPQLVEIHFTRGGSLFPRTHGLLDGLVDHFNGDLRKLVAGGRPHHPIPMAVRDR